MPAPAYTLALIASIALLVLAIARGGIEAAIRGLLGSWSGSELRGNAGLTGTDIAELGEASGDREVGPPGSVVHGCHGNREARLLALLQSAMAVIRRLLAPTSGPGSGTPTLT